MKNSPVPDTASKPLRHCMVVHARYPYGETRVEREALALVDHGYEVDIICLMGGDEPAVENINGINVFRMPMRRRKGISTIRQLFEYLSFFVLAFLKIIALHLKRHYSVVQIHNLPDWLVFVGLFPKLTGARVILDLHDLMPEFYAARFQQNFTSLPVRLLIWQEQISCQFADHVITVTEGWKETLIRRGLPASKVSVVMNLPDIRYFSQFGENSQPITRNGNLNLLYHGNLTHRYGIDLALHAVGKVRKQIPNIQLHIHGWGDAGPALMALSEELGLKDCVRFTAVSLPTSELPKMISEADVCLVPYRRDVFTDGILPTKLMEYAAMKKPAITARTTTIQAYFKETMVEFFEPGDADDLARCITRLYCIPGRMDELSRGIDEFNHCYNWKKVSATYVALVEGLRKR